MLEAGSDESSEDDQSSEDIQSSEVLETTIPTGNVTESDESSEEEEIDTTTPEITTPETTTPETTTPETTTPETTTPETTTPETTEPTYDPLVEPTVPAEIVYPDKPAVQPTYFKPRINRYAFIHIIRFKLFRVEETGSRFLIRFVLLLRFINLSPFAQVKFNIKVIYRVNNNVFRELQEEYEDATVLCIKSSQFPYEKSVIDSYYICSTEVNKRPINVESYNDFDFRDSEGLIVEYSSSLQVIKASKSLNEETQPMREVVSFDNAQFSKGTNPSYDSLIIKGKLRGTKRNEVAAQEKLIFTFYEDKGDIINALNSTCDVNSHNPDNFEIECYPESFHINGTQQFLLNGTTAVADSESKNNIEIYLNTTELSDSFTYYSEPIVNDLNRGANVHFLGYNNYYIRPNPRPLNPLRPVIIEFNVFIRYVDYTPFGKVVFTLTLTYRTVVYMRGLRGLQEEITQTNTSAICEYKDIDNSTNTSLYGCTAEAEKVPESTEALNNFEYYDADGLPVVLEEEQVNYARDAIEGAKNLTTQVSTYTDIVSFNDVYFYLNENDQNSFFVRGTLAGNQSEYVSKQDSFIMTFYDTINKEEKYGYNTTCDVVNRELNDFLVKCSPNHNVTGDQFLANGTIHDNTLGIYLNNTNNSRNFEFRTYSKNDANVKWRKNSSGLSGGAIAGIVIACAVALILITILAMFFRRSKMAPTNNSTIVGLKSIDNYNE